MTTIQIHLGLAVRVLFFQFGTRYQWFPGSHHSIRLVIPHQNINAAQCRPTKHKRIYFWWSVCHYSHFEGVARTSHWNRCPPPFHSAPSASPSHKSRDINPEKTCIPPPPPHQPFCHFISMNALNIFSGALGRITQERQQGIPAVIRTSP